MTTPQEHMAGLIDEDVEAAFRRRGLALLDGRARPERRGATAAAAAAEFELAVVGWLRARDARAEALVNGSSRIGPPGRPRRRRRRRAA